MPWETCGLPRCHEPVSGYCSVSAPCGEGQGDCNYNAQCKGSLICGTDNCDGAYASTDDCCYDPATHTGEGSYILREAFERKHVAFLRNFSEGGG